MELTRRELNKYKSRQRILKASRHLFGSKGFEDTMMEEVAELAEISRGTLYNYFPSKESLLFGIVEEEMAKVREALADQTTPLNTSEEKLNKVVELLVLDSLDYPELSRKIAYLNSYKESPLFGSRTDMLKLLRELALAAQGEGCFRRDIPVDDIVDVYMSVYLMALFEWRELECYPKEYCISKVERFLCYALKGIRIR